MSLLGVENGARLQFDGGIVATAGQLRALKAAYENAMDSERYHRDAEAGYTEREAQRAAADRGLDAAHACAVAEGWTFTRRDVDRIIRDKSPVPAS